jgi:hypothetical protein
VKKNRSKAERAWPAAVQAAEGDWGLIVMGLQVQLDLDRFDLSEEGRWCPHPQTWLRDRRWLDGVEADGEGATPKPQPRCPKPAGRESNLAWMREIFPVQAQPSASAKPVIDGDADYVNDDG